MRGDNLKLVRSLVVSRVTHSLPYLNMKLSEEQQAEIIIKQAYKTALRLPICTLTGKRLALRVHNTFQEHKEATQGFRASTSRVTRNKSETVPTQQTFLMTSAGSSTWPQYLKNTNPNLHQVSE
ncbi:hypothetical protein HPB48_010357 [Haemaphysalis longicornis]|uniref:Uncharacterized protein n=1 Tax=Haemaphysalis longicornis TaxID=44386 RepID=A0A9J6GJU4_HAELO|nr:hypothetical protein HPB48_010357 [Haemaphysalis longicornis]